MFLNLNMLSWLIYLVDQMLKKYSLSFYLYLQICQNVSFHVLSLGLVWCEACPAGGEGLDLSCTVGPGQLNQLIRALLAQ